MLRRKGDWEVSHLTFEKIHGIIHKRPGSLEDTSGAEFSGDHFFFLVKRTS